MKGCFLLQRSFAPVGHAMALAFKKKYGIDKHCALITVRDNYFFLKNQTDVDYTGLILDEDIHAAYKDEKLDLDYLKWLEKEYGLPNLWPYLSIDRILLHGQFLRSYPYDQPLYDHADLLKMLQVTAKKIIAFLETEKPSFIFFPAVGSLAPLLLYEIARKKGIPVFLGEYSRFKNHYLITENPRGFQSLNARFLKIKNKELLPAQQTREYAGSLIQSYHLKPTVYDETATPERQPLSRYKQMKFLLPSNLYQPIRWFFKTFVDYYFGKKKKDYTQINPWFYLIDRLRKKIRVLIGYDDLYDSLDDNEDFAYFSLSFEPELSLLFYSPFATDQIGIIKQLAQSLPVHYKLYVKEHPLMVGDRPRKFYQAIKKMPNVKLIHPSVKNFDIIQKSKLVATINGTAGWEAVLFKKPCITFGHAFYNPLSMVKYCTSMHHLPELVKNQLENFRYDELELHDFVTALMEDTAPVDMIHLWERRDQSPDTEKMALAVGPLVDLIAKKLGLT